MFLEIAETSNYRLLLQSGEATDDQCNEQWESLVEQYNYHSGNAKHIAYKNHLRNYRDLLRKLVTVDECLTYLLGAIDTDMIQWLATQGYRIDTRTATSYARSILVARNKATNLNSKLKQKYNQLAMFNEGLMERRAQYNQGTVDERLAELSFALGFALDDQITLARYNEYVKLINKQQQHGSGKKGHNNG